MEYTLYSYGSVPGVFGGNSLIRIPKFDMVALRFRLVLPVVCPVRHRGVLILKLSAIQEAMSQLAAFMPPPELALLS